MAQLIIVICSAGHLKPYSTGFCVWIYVKDKVYSTKPPIINDLKAKVEREYA